MSEEYKFSVIKVNREFGKDYIKQILSIDASGSTFDRMTFYCTIMLNHKTDKQFIIERVKIRNTAIFDNTPSRLTEDSNKTSYLKGYFQFKTLEDVDRAVHELRERFNCMTSNYETFSTRWDNFAWQFQRWFEENMMLTLNKELELHRLYFKINE